MLQQLPAGWPRRGCVESLIKVPTVPAVATPLAETFFSGVRSLEKVYVLNPDEIGRTMHLMVLHEFKVTFHSKVYPKKEDIKQLLAAVFGIRNQNSNTLK